MNNQRLRIGVIGAGWFASRRHLPDIQKHPETSLVALCRRDPEALIRLRDHFQPQEIYRDWQEMLERSSLDAVIIASPHSLHFEQAHAALTKGLHVLLEKPMTVRSHEARILCDLAHAQNRVLSVALNPPFWAHCHRLKNAIQDGRIGQLETVDLFWTGNAEYVFGEASPPPDLPGIVPPTMYRANAELCGGGYLIDGGSHLISELLWVTNLRAKRVTCQMDATPSDRRAALTIMLENGVLANVLCIGDSARGERRVRNLFAGSTGTLTVEGFDFRVTMEGAGGPVETFRECDLPTPPGPLASFIDAIRGRCPLFAPPEHGLHVVEVVEAAYRSAATGLAVMLGSETSVSDG